MSIVSPTFRSFLLSCCSPCDKVEITSFEAKAFGQLENFEFLLSANSENSSFASSNFKTLAVEDFPKLSGESDFLFLFDKLFSSSDFKWVPLLYLFDGTKSFFSPNPLLEGSEKSERVWMLEGGFGGRLEEVPLSIGLK